MVVAALVELRLGVKAERKSARRCGAAALIGCIVLLQRSGGSVGVMAFRIAQISDTHLSETKPYFVDNFVRIGEALRVAKPDLVVNTGDISLDGASEERDLAAGRLLHDALGLPLRFLPGNHDLGDAPGDGELWRIADRWSSAARAT